MTGIAICGLAVADMLRSLATVGQVKEQNHRYRVFLFKW